MSKTNEKHWEPLLGYVTEAEAEAAFDNYYGCPTAQQDLIDNNLNNEQETNQ